MDQSNRIMSIVTTDNEKFVTIVRFIECSLSKFLSAMQRFENSSAVGIDKNIDNLTPTNSKNQKRSMEAASATPAPLNTKW